MKKELLTSALVLVLAAGAYATVTVVAGKVAPNAAAGSVVATSIGTGAVQTAKIAADAVTTVKIINGAVNTAKLATDSVTTPKLITAAVDTRVLATDSVTPAKILSDNDGCLKVSGGALNCETAANGGASVATTLTNESSVTMKGALNVAGVTTFGDVWNLTKSQNSTTQLTVANGTQGAASDVILVLTDNSAGSTLLSEQSGSYTTAGCRVAGGGMLINNGPGGLSIGGTQGTSGMIRFYTDGEDKERMRIDNAGLVGIGTVNPVGNIHIMSGTVDTAKVHAGDATHAACLMLGDSDQAGCTECISLNGVLSCAVDADCVCDGSL